jgi:penicillin-binding protein 1C
VSGTSGAAPVWAAVMNHLHARERSIAPAAPTGLVRTATRFGSHLEAARSEWFLAGTEQGLIAVDASSAPERAARITEPAAGTIVALDPDIPPARQRLRLQAQGRDVHWRIDGKLLARGPQAHWLPWPGRHAVQLVDAKGVVLDEIRIEVRGAGVRTAAAPRPG